MADVFAVLGKRLVQRRKELNIDQATAAAAVGISPQYLSDIERGVKQPGVVRLVVDLARYYHTPLDYLTGLSDIPQTAAQLVGWAPPVDTVLREMLELTPAAQAEAAALVSTFAAHERSRAEEAAAQGVALTALEAVLPPPTMDALLALLESALANGESDIVTRRRIAALLAPED